MKLLEQQFNNLSLFIYENIKNNIWIEKFFNSLNVLCLKNELKNFIISYISKILMYTLLLFIISLFIFVINFNLYILIFPLLCPIALIYDLKIKIDNRINEMKYYFPNFIYNVALLVSAGIHIQRAIDIIYENLDKNDENVINYVLNYIYIEKNKGKSLLTSFMDLALIFKLRMLNNFNLILKQSIQNGIYNTSDLLIELAENIEKEREYDIKQMAEKLSSKLLAPLMVSLVGIMAMLIIPVSIQIRM